MFQIQSNIRIDINKYFFNTDGELIDKNTLPSHLKTKLPWWLFCKFDYDCNYRNASKIIDPYGQWVYVGVYNRSSVKFLFTGYNTVQAVMQNGDVSLMFTDDIRNPSYYALIVMSSQGSALSGITQNIEFFSPYFDLFSSNREEDYIESLTFGEVSRFGIALRYDHLPIARYYTPNTPPRNGKILINKEVNAGFQSFMGGYINFNTSAYYVDFREIAYN